MINFSGSLNLLIPYQMSNMTEQEAPRKVDVIDCVLEFSENLTSEQLARLLEIADRGPVHRSLEGAILIRTSLKSG